MRLVARLLKDRAQCSMAGVPGTVFALDAIADIPSCAGCLRSGDLSRISYATACNRRRTVKHSRPYHGLYSIHLSTDGVATLVATSWLPRQHLQLHDHTATFTGRLEFAIG
jgi:hypothetical protein